MGVIGSANWTRFLVFVAGLLLFRIDNGRLMLPFVGLLLLRIDHGPLGLEL